MTIQNKIGVEKSPSTNLFPNYLNGGKMKMKKTKKTKTKTKKTTKKNKGKRGGNCGCGGLFQNGGQGSGLSGANFALGTVGQPWTATEWPGQDGISGNRNFYALNEYNQYNPQTVGIVNERSTISLKGGKHKRNKKTIKRKRKHSKKGGTLLPQDLVNVGRNISFQIGKTYNALSGVPPPVNPMPTKGQFMREGLLL